MVKRPKPSIPDYHAAHVATVRYTREAMKGGCEVCGRERSKGKTLYVFKLKGQRRIRCACRKHLRRIK